MMKSERTLRKLAGYCARLATCATISCMRGRQLLAVGKGSIAGRKRMREGRGVRLSLMMPGWNRQLMRCRSVRLR